MKLSNIKDYTRGWFIGAFPNALFETEMFEVGLISCPKGNHPTHHHKIATEYNVIVEGSVCINGSILQKGDIYVVNPNESTKQDFLEDSLILCIKTPSVLGDKYLDEHML